MYIFLVFSVKLLTSQLQYKMSLNEELDLTLQEVKRTYIKRKRSRRVEYTDEGTSTHGREQRRKQTHEQATHVYEQHQGHVVHDDDNDETTEEEVDRSTSTAMLKTRMSPAQFQKLIENLTDQQKNAVRDIGFGSLLQLQVTCGDNKLSTYLVQNFDVYRCALKLEDEEMLLTEDDVDSTLGLPHGPLQVIEGNNSNATEDYNNLLTQWRARWNVPTCGPITKTLCDGILAMKEHGDMFKRDFVVFVVSTMLKGHTNRSSNFKVLYSLINVDKIKEYNWCRYVFTSLIRSVERWKKKPTSNFTGPLVFLLVIPLIQYLLYMFL